MTNKDDIVLTMDGVANSSPNLPRHRGIFIVLCGILVTLIGILYVIVEYTGVFQASSVEQQCLTHGGKITISTTGGKVCDLEPYGSPGELFGSEDYAIDEWADIPTWTAKEIHCRDINGSVTWSTNGSKICDVKPYTMPGGSFGSEDWIIESGQFVNPFGE